MRELSSCLSDYAVQVSDTSCSGNTTNSCIAPSSTPSPSIKNTVTSLYRATLSNRSQTTIAVTWTRATSSSSQCSLTVAVSFDDDPSVATFKIKINTTHYFRKPKGCKSLQLRSSKVELHWDLSTARYLPSGPEPLDGFYLVVTVDDSEVALILGDKHRELSVPAPSKRKLGRPTTLVSRQEHFSGNAAVYSTKAQFCDSGSAHDIVIRCGGEVEEGAKQATLWVCVDKKTVIRVKRLQWNFRGIHTIFVDGLLVDLMWDVHDWFFNNHNPDSNYAAVFMFRTRSSGLDSRLWLEEMEKKLLHHYHHNHHRLAFSFIILASKN